ncbi:MAG: hypothetical protein PHC61_05225 [Chitinivibrionales bacterium]|nr:hypothetical protein [Chitinivibrionales bacterium]
MVKKYLLIAFGVVMVFSFAVFAAQRTAVLVTIKDHGYSSDSSYYFIKTNEALGGACTDSTLYWSASNDAGKSAIATLQFYLNRGNKVRISYNDNAQDQVLINILDPIQ